MLKYILIFILYIISVTSAVNIQWMQQQEVSAIEPLVQYFPGYDDAAGALWEWRQDSNNKQWVTNVHEPWKNGSGIVFADFTVSLPNASAILLSFQAKVGQPGGDGIGLTILVQENNRFISVFQEIIPADEKSHDIKADMSKWAGKTITFRVQVDPNGNSNADTAVLSSWNFTSEGKNFLNSQALRENAKLGFMLESRLNDMEIALCRPKDTSIMDQHVEGRRPKVNIYSRLDSYRPLIGAHVYLTEAAKSQLPVLRDFLDFAAHDAGFEGNRAFELAGMPWIRANHTGIPLGRWDTVRIDTSRRIGEVFDQDIEKYRFMLGVTSGSEPHISPDYYYTGHTKKEVESLPRTPESSADFGDWMASLYQDQTPSVDSNKDGKTFESDFGFTADSWDKIGLAMPADGEKILFLKTLYREHIVYEAIKRTDQDFGNTQKNVIVSTRLLSSQYSPVFGQSLRQLELPSQTVGVTYYTQKSMALDPQQTQAMFAVERLYKTEKTFTSSLLIRPPFHEIRGACIGLFGPYTQADAFKATLKAGYNDGDVLTVTIEQTLADQPLDQSNLTSMQWVLAPKSSEDITLVLKKTEQPFYIKLTVRPQKKNAVTTLNHKVFVIEPVLEQKTAVHSLVDDYTKSDLYVVLDTMPGKALSIGHAISQYDPAITEYRGGYLYQQAKERGLRTVYNEFQPGNSIGNTPENVYRSIFHELQFKPAVINWFCYVGGDTNTAFSWMDTYYMATEFATLRGQLEVSRPYLSIERPKRPLAVFLPIAAPEPIGKQIAMLERILPNQLVKYGPDVFLSNQLDQYEKYENILIVLGFIDGVTDNYLKKLLKNIPADKRIMILCGSSQLYCEPGIRGSSDFTQSLKDVLPLNPVSLKASSVMLKIKDGLELSLSAADRIERNESFKNGEWLVSEKRTLSWRDAHLMMVAGIPEKGLEELIENFFGLPVPAMREAGALKILNRDATAKEPGWYCLDVDQQLTIPDAFAGYNLPRRMPVSNTVAGEAVVRVLSPDAFELLDAGTAQVHMKRIEKNMIVLDAALPVYTFEGGVNPELIIFSSTEPKVFCQEIPQAVETLKQKGFYRCSINQAGEFRITR